MAYGFPATYQPMYYPSTIQQVPQQVPQPPTQQTQNNLIWVSGEAGAKAYLLAPNTTMPLWDSESQTIFLKSTDGSGMPTIKYLDYTVRDSSQPTNNVVDSYVTKEEIADITAQLADLKRRMDNLSSRTKRGEGKNE